MPGAASRRTAAAVAERGRHPRRARAQSRQHAEQQSRQHRHEGGKRQGRAVDADFIETRDAGRPDRDQRANARVREQHARRTAHERQHRALDEHLPDEPGPAGPERHANRVLLAAAFRSNQQQVGDVAACNEQDESDGSEHDQQRLAGVADDLLAERAHDGAAIEDVLEPTRAVAKLIEAGDQAPSIIGRGFDGDARFEPGDRTDEVCAEVVARGVELKRNPGIDLRRREVVDARA